MKTAHDNLAARPIRQNVSRLLMAALVLVCTLLCSCSRTPSAQNESGDDRPLISTDETRQVGMHVLLNRYPDAQIVSEQSEGQFSKYRFATNGVTVPLLLVVDRKAAKARFENLNR